MTVYRVIIYINKIILRVHRTYKTITNSKDEFSSEAQKVLLKSISTESLLF